MLNKFEKVKIGAPLNKNLSSDLIKMAWIWNLKYVYLILHSAFVALNEAYNTI